MYFVIPVVMVTNYLCTITIENFLFTKQFCYSEEQGKLGDLLSQQY